MSSFDTPTILVVEDDDIVRMLMVDVLEELDFRVLEADGWDPALAALSGQHPVDLLVTDVGLGDDQDRTGLDLAREALLLRPGIPVLVASGYGNTLDLPKGAQLLSKPFTIDSLRDTVNALLPERAAPLF
jgi:CheY-like chemotaxis protein